MSNPATLHRQRALELMLAEFESHHLEVVLVPARREANAGAMVRVAVAKNCTWYRGFCARHRSDRRRKNAAVDTKIKRAATLATLRRLVAGLPSRSKYAPELERIALSLAARTAA